MATKDGGPVFPEAVSADGLGGLNYSRNEGMSLRDYFAGQALAGMLASPPLIDRSPNKVKHAGWARNAYMFADAMLAEREK